MQERMNIVILDGYTLNPHDLDWAPIEQLGKTTIYDRTSADQLLKRAQHADILLTNKVPLNAETIAKLPKLKAIFVMATGYNVVDIVAANRRGIPVCNVSGYGANSVAQHTFSLLLALTNQVAEYDKSVKEGQWAAQSDFCYYLSTHYELTGKTLGIIGLGEIGKAVARIGLGFGMKIISLKRETQREPMPEVRLVDERMLFAESDVLTLHSPLTTDNVQFINALRLSWMKPSAYLINTARGGLIHEQDLATALRKGIIAGAALDVLSTEPPPSDHPLLHAPRCLITPHVAWAAQEARQRLLNILTQNIAAFLNGSPQNVVNNVT